MSGNYGDLTPEQQKTLDSFKERLATDLNEKEREQYSKLLERGKTDPEIFDRTLLRYLRARKFDLEVSFKMFTDCLNWRVDFQGIGVDAITKDSIQNELALMKAFNLGVDKNNRPVSYIRVRAHDPSANFEEMQRFCVYMMERGKDILPKGVEHCCVIFDMNQFSFGNMDLKMLRFFCDMFERYYPESLGQALVLNAPWIFWGFWTIISAWIPAETAPKVKFLSNHEELLEHIEKENLLNDYGGLATIDQIVAP